MKKFSSNHLTGGCHFDVAKIELEYVAMETRAPKHLVVKLLWWQKAWHEKLFLYIKKMLGFFDKEIMYLHSYEIESRFYTHFTKQIQGRFEVVGSKLTNAVFFIFKV